MKIEKNEESFKELNALAKEKGQPLKAFLLDDNNLDLVSATFYKHMPKMVRWSMNAEKFKAFYLKNRQNFVAHLPEKI